METRRPLDGIRVLELAQVVAGPFCGTLMAEFGAEVIKTEMPGKGDDLRRLGPSEDGVSYWFAVDNRNKKLMTLDLRTPKGQEIVRRLVPQCDVVLENFRPGVLEKWGLGWETLRALNPRLVMARITAFGQTGPLRQGPGYAAIASAFGATEWPKHIDVILEMAGRWFAARSFDKAMDELHAHDIPHSPIMSMADIFADPHVRAREMIVDVPSDIGALPQPAVVPKLSGTPGRITHAGAALGRHTDEVLTGLLGMSRDEIAALRAEGVI